MGEKKQKLFFRIVTMGLLVCCVCCLWLSEYSGDEDVMETVSSTCEADTRESTVGEYRVTTYIPEDTLIQNSQLTDSENTEEIVSTYDSKETISMGQSEIKVKGIYVTGPVAGSKKMNQLMELVDSTELNAMVIDIKNDSGEITYKMDYDVAQAIGATKNYIPDIQSLISQLKEKNIYLIARIVAFKDPILAEKLPAYSLKNTDGSIFRDKKGLAWVNPYSKGVWDYILNVAYYAAEIGFDEIQFDYIRFSTDAGMENVVFSQEEELPSKAEIVTQFTEYVSDRLKLQGVKVSADVYGGIIGSEVDRDIVGQDYGKMSEHLDCICPMIYPSQFAKGSYGVSNPDSAPYEIIYQSLLDSKEKLAGNQNIMVRPWLQDFTATWLDSHITYDKEEIEAQIKAVYDSGYEEWILWNAGNNYTVEGIGT